MKIGPYTISAIETGNFKLDGGAMFGVVPKTLWSRTNPSDDQNRIEMTARCLLIESADKKILVDAGVGHKEPQKFNDIFAVDFSRNTLLQSLLRHGINPGDVTDFIYTHLHFDHAGGSTHLVNNEAVPLFPNARHYVQRLQYEHALSRNERDRASYMDWNYEPVKNAGMLELLDCDVEIFPGLHLEITSGHSPFLQMIRITDGNTTLWFPSDLIPLSAHLPYPYIMGYDLFPMVTLEDKKKLLPRAVDEKWIIVFEHDPHCIACTVVRDDKGRIVKGESLNKLPS